MAPADLQARFDRWVQEYERRWVYRSALFAYASYLLAEAERRIRRTREHLGLG